MERTRSKISLILLSLVSPFSLLHYLSGIIYLVASFFKSSGPLIGLLLILMGLFNSCVLFYLSLRDPHFIDSKVNKELNKHASIVFISGLIVTGFVFVSSLLYHLDVKKIIEACGINFLIGLPSGIVPLLFFINKDFNEEILYKKIKRMLFDFIPLLIGEAFIIIFFSVFNFNLAFVNFSLPLIHLVIYFLMHMPTFLGANKNPIKLNVREESKNDLLYTGILSLSVVMALLASFFTFIGTALANYSLEYNFSNISTILLLDEYEFNNFLSTLFITLSTSLIFLIYGSTAFRMVDKKEEIIRIIFVVSSIAILVAVLRVDIFSALFYQFDNRLTYLSLAMLYGLIPVFTSLVIEIIILRKKKTN